MSAWLTTLFLLLVIMASTKALCKEEDDMDRWARHCATTLHKQDCILDHDMARREAIQMVLEAIEGSKIWARTTLNLDEVGGGDTGLSDCVKLYEDCEERLQRLLILPYGRGDALTWLSGALTSHTTCLDGLRDMGRLVPDHDVAHNLTVLLSRALALFGLLRHEEDRMPSRPKSVINEGLLASWDTSNSRADYVVAKDGSGSHKTINEAVAALAHSRQNWQHRVVIYVKSGVYIENVEIDRNMMNVMFIGDGIDKTIVTGNRNVVDGASNTFNTATFGVSGDGFWARDMTFENTAGPQKHQAVALRVSSDLSVFYRCSFKGFQDTLFVHSLRQFYRDCHVYGTIDFIFGNAAVVFQNCDIYLRRPMDHQSNMITAQGREDPNQTTGISIHASRVLPAPDFQSVKGSFESYLGRPWKEFSRTVFLKTDLAGLIDPRGWKEWQGNFGLSTLFYGEYMNSGDGAFTDKRVNWPGFHVLSDARDAAPFSVSRFIQGESWIPMTGVPILFEV